MAVAGGGREKAVEEEAYAGMRSMEELLRLISEDRHRRNDDKPQVKVEEEEDDCRRVADTAVKKFRKVISLLEKKGPTGHARFRRSPLVKSSVEEREKAELEEKRRVPVVVKEEENNDDDDRRQPIKVYCPKPIQRLPPPPHPRYTHYFQPPTISLTSSTTTSSAFRVMARTPKTTTANTATIASSYQLLTPAKRMFDIDHEETTSGGPKCSLQVTSGGARCHCSKKSFTRRQEDEGQKNGDSTGDKHEIVGDPLRRLLLEEVRSETNQRVAISKGILQVQQFTRLSGEETRRTCRRRPYYGRRDIRGRSQPHNPDHH